MQDNLQDAVVALLGKKDATTDSDGFQDASTNAKLNYLQEQINSLESKTGSLDTKINTNNEKLVDNQQKLEGLRSAIDSLGSSSNSSGRIKMAECSVTGDYYKGIIHSPSGIPSENIIGYYYVYKSASCEYGVFTPTTENIYNYSSIKECVCFYYE